MSLDFGDDPGSIDTSNFDYGTTNDSQPVTIPPDPSGGTGAIDPTFLGTASNGLNASLGSGFASQIGSLVGLAAVNAAGSLVYKATAGSIPQATGVPVSQATVSASFPLKTLLLAGGALIVLLLILRK